MLKKLHLEPKPAQCPGAVAVGGLGLPSHYPRGLMNDTQDSLSNSSFAPSLLSIPQGMGPSSEEGRAMELCSSSFSIFLWPSKLCKAHSASSLGHCNIMIQGQQALRGETKKLWPRDHWEKNNFEGFSSVFRNRRYFRSNEKVHCWKKSHKTWNRKLILKSFLCFTEQFALKYLLLKNI